jgi:hypothetical protein
MTEYKVKCERIGEWWEIQVPNLPFGQTTQTSQRDLVVPVTMDLIGAVTGKHATSIEVQVNIPDENHQPGSFRRWASSAASLAKRASPSNPPDQAPPLVQQAQLASRPQHESQRASHSIPTRYP